ncbi:hypothetical protein FNPHOIGM_00032 [Dickeya phage DchS19]|uniref:Uncharacterized protein n=2 Tax=Ningirsuvirus TaxID=2732688 RepID=A0A9E7LUT0_9CAUD|nr:hypothetical protein SIB_17 [Klebsiella phage vB_KpnP_Sibilus]URX37669.1 hypothetical protein FNPHOIGM_00032 [Dickeya phage DchS19]
MFTSKSNFEKIAKNRNTHLSMGQTDAAHERDEHIKNAKKRRKADRAAVRNGKRNGWED